MSYVCERYGSRLVSLQLLQDKVFDGPFNATQNLKSKQFEQKIACFAFGCEFLVPV